MGSRRVKTLLSTLLPLCFNYTFSGMIVCLHRSHGFYINVDINECAPNEGLGPCAQICTNIPGSFICSCKSGYTLSGYKCEGE